MNKDELLRKEIEKGEQLFSEGKVDEAKKLFENLYSRQKQNHIVLNNLGVIATEEGKLDKARQYFLDAVECGGDVPDILLNLIDIFETFGDWKSMVQYLERYISKNEKDIEQLNRLGKAYTELKLLKEAFNVYEKSLRIDPDQNDVKAIYQQLQRLVNPESSKDIRKLNILFVQEYPCIRNYKMAKALRSRGHRVTLAYTKYRLSQVYKDLSDDVYSENIHLQSHRHLWDISSNYDLIHCHNEPDVLTVAALAGKTPVIHDTHDLISLRANGDPNLAYFEGIANRGASGRVYSTPYQMEEAKRLYGVQGLSLVFYNYASEEDLPKKFLPKLSARDGKVHIVYEGGIGGTEHRDFIELFKELAEEGIHIHIYPSYFNKELAKFFQQYSFIHYYEPLSPKEIMEAMTQYDFGIIPFNLKKGNKRFLDTTIANKLFEYLAAGLPVIASPLKTYIEYFKKNPVGITFDNTRDILNKIPQLQKISRETDFSKQVYTYEREIKKLEDFYCKILEGKRPNIEVKRENTTIVETSDFYLDSFNKLLDWIQQNGWDGYDPYDIQDYFIQQSKAGTLISPEEQVRINQEAKEDPLGIREKLGINKKRNAKALGLLTSAYVRLYKVFEEERFLKEAESIAAWLLEHPSEGYSHLCWGYPFDWQSVIFIPKGTPSAVVSTVVGDSLWELYNVTRNDKYLKACESICFFITEDLKMDDMRHNGVCFSYTPIDNYHVHNANLFCGNFLARVGKEVENSAWMRLAERTAKYAISEQNPDGSIFYWGKIQNEYAPNKLDHYHSGFEIRCLYGLYQHLGEEKIKESYQKYLKFYLRSYFLPDGTPKITPNNPYPVDIHGAAESVLLLSHLSTEHPELFDLAGKSLAWTIKNMQQHEGWFIHLWTPEEKIEAPYLRWGQCWMLRAFAEYFSAEKIKKGEWGFYSQFNSVPGKKALKKSKSTVEELLELRELALNYANLDNGQIPAYVIQDIAESLDLNASNEEKKKAIFENLRDADQWKRFIRNHISNVHPDKQNSIENRERVLNYQFMMPPTEQSQYGSKEWAEKLFRKSRFDPWGHDWRASQKTRYSVSMDMVKKHILADDIKKILDIGCALGDFTRLLKEYFTGAKILGVDISETAVQKCRMKYSEIQFEPASLPDLEIGEDEFDFVVALEVIYYLNEEKIDQSLKRIYEIVKRGGYVLISTYLNKPPFVTPENFKKTISRYFSIVDEINRYHALYTQYETIIRQSMDSISKLSETIEAKSLPEVSDFLRAGVNLLGNVELVNLANEYSKKHLGKSARSHSILLCRKQ